VPRPRLHLIRFHGVLAPNAKLRALMVPRAPEDATGESEVPATESGCTYSRPARISWARLLKRVFGIDLKHCPSCGGQLKIIAAILEARGTRADPQALGVGGPGTAPGAGARRFSAGGVKAARYPGLRGGAAPDAGRAWRGAMKRVGLPDVQAGFGSGRGAAAAQCAIGQANVPPKHLRAREFFPGGKEYAV